MFIEHSLRIIMFALVTMLSVQMVTAVTEKRFVANTPESKIVISSLVSSVGDIDRQLRCLTRNVYFEAGNEPPEGKIAVAQITVNRLSDGRFGDDICAVVHAKNSFTDRIMCQFSWLCDGSEKRRTIKNEMWNESEVAAKKVLLEGFRLPSLGDALYFHATYVNPQWRNLERVATIGNHVFYKSKV